MIDKNDALPAGWVVAPLEKLLVPLEDGRTLHHGWSPQCEKGAATSDEHWGVLKTTAIQPGAFLPEHNKRLPPGLLPRPQHEVKEGDLLITCAGPRVRCGIPCLVTSTRPRLMLSGKMYRFRVSDNHFDARYLEKYLLSHTAQVAIDAMKTGGSDSGLNLTHDRFKPLAVPVAPLNEQRRIASKIDELFSRIEEGERALERVQKLVERYRQSVLKAAVTGELTCDWREKNKGKLESGEALLARILKARREAWEKAELDKMKAKGITPANDKWKQKYGEPVPPNATGLPALPAGWAWASVDQLCKEFGNGLSKKPGHHPPGIPILRISAVRPLAVDAADLRYYVPDENESTDTFRVGDGDLLFTRYNGSKELVGVSGVFRGSETVLHPDKLIRARVASELCLSPDYLAMALNCGWSKKHLDGCVKTSAGQHGIAGSDIKRAPVPLPSFAEQGRLNDLVSVALSKCIDATTTTASQLRRAQSSRQSILRSAFAGQLVPQDHSDETASALLERIAVERGTAPAKPNRNFKSKTRIPA